MNSCADESVLPRRSLLTLALALALAAASAFLSAVPARADSAPEKILIPADRFHPPQNETTADQTQGLLDPDRRFNFDGFRTRIDGLWFKRKAFLRKNLPDAASEQIEAIEDLEREVGVTRLDTIAAGLVHEGRGYLEEGNFEKANHSFRDSERFAPDLPEAHLGLAASHWRAGSPGASLGELVAGMRGFLESRTLSSAMLGNALIISILAVAATALLISLAMLLRYHPLVRHDLLETLAAKHPGRFSKEMLTLLGWLLIALPLVTWVAALWTPAYWLTLTFRYQSVREKAISAILFILLVLSAPAARSAEILFALAADPSARLMLASTSLSYDPEQVVVLAEKADANPQDPAYRFLLGCVYSRGRYFDDALTEFRRVIELDPTSYRAYNNIGNIFLRTGQPEESLKHYGMALGLRSDFLPAYYNVYLARKEMLQLRESEQALHEGQKADPEGMARLVDEARVSGAGEPAEAVISRDEVFRRILGEGREEKGVASAFVSLPAVLVGVFFLAALVVSRALGKRHASRCVKCGEPFCVRCKAGVQAPEYCSQCQQVFLKRDGLSPVVRREKVSDLERFRAHWARLSQVCSLVFPGMSRLLDGRTLTGAIASAVWCGSILALILRPRLLHLPGAGSVHPFFPVTVLLVSLAAAAWLAGNRRAVRDAGAPAGSWRWH